MHKGVSVLCRGTFPGARYYSWGTRGTEIREKSYKTAFVDFAFRNECLWGNLGNKIHYPKISIEFAGRMILIHCQSRSELIQMGSPGNLLMLTPSDLLIGPGEYTERKIESLVKLLSTKHKVYLGNAVLQ